MSDAPEDRRGWRVVHEGDGRREGDGGRVVVVERPANGNGKHPVAQTIGVVASAVAAVGGVVWMLIAQSVEIAGMKAEVKDMRGLCLYGLAQVENRVQIRADIAEIHEAIERVRKQLGGGG